MQQKSLVQRILNRETTFRKEALDFYDLSISNKEYYNFIPVNFELKKENLSKKGTYPKDLVEILSITSSKSFDIDKLRYESVRASCQGWDQYRIKKIGIMLGCGALFLLTIPTSLAFAAANNYLYSIISGSVCLIAFASAMFTKRTFPNPKNIISGFNEFKSLYNIASNRDSDISRFDYMTNSYNKSQELIKTLKSYEEQRK